MIFNLDDAKVEDQTVLMFGIRYNGSTSGKVYTFAALKAGGRWYFTGTGPRDAGWGAVQRWLQSDGREVVWIRAVTGMELVWPISTPMSPAQAKANHPSRTGSPAASMANLAAEQRGDDLDDLDDLDEPLGGNDPDLQ